MAAAHLTRLGSPIALCASHTTLPQISTVRTASALLSYTPHREKSSYQCVVLGGGTAGCAMASKMARKLGVEKVAVVEPADVSTEFLNRKYN